MAVAKQKQPQQRDLGADIAELQAAMLAFLEDRVAALKLGRDGAGLPVEVLKHQLARGDNCLCRVIDRLLNELN